MKVIHSGSCDVRSGGPALSTWLTIKGLRGLGVEAIDVMEQTEPEHVIAEELRPVFSRRAILRPLCYVRRLGGLLAALGRADIYHVQGLWMLHGWQVARFARRGGTPYVVTLRGMLYPQAVAHKRLLKKLSLAAYQRSVLEGAAAVQCTCVEEMEHYRALGFSNPVAVIPDPTDDSNVSGIAKQMLDLYEWILGKGVKPDFVFTT